MAKEQKSEQKKVHVKSLRNPMYIGAHTLIEMGVSEVEATISKVTREKAHSNNGETVQATIVYLNEFKPLWLNKTNEDNVIIALGTPFVHEWVGKKITLCIEKVLQKSEHGLASVDDMFVDAIRVKKYATKDQAELLTADHPKFLRIKQGIAMGSVTLEQVKSKYSFDDKTEKLLTNGGLV